MLTARQLPQLDVVLAALRQEFAAGIRVFSASPLVFDRVVETEDAGHAALLALSALGLLRARASIRCRLHHPMGEVDYDPHVALPARRCQRCWDEDEREDGGEGGFVLTFQPTSRFGAGDPGSIPLAPEGDPSEKASPPSGSRGGASMNRSPELTSPASKLWFRRFWPDQSAWDPLFMGTTTRPSSPLRTVGR